MLTDLVYCGPRHHQEISMLVMSRRQFAMSVPAALGSASLVSACSPAELSGDYQAAVDQTWRPGSGSTIEGAALSQELVRHATLAPSSHNTQCWKFRVQDHAITILPDLSRRCPAVDPDDHHVFVSLGCATENLVQAALAHGRHADARFDASQDAIQVRLSPAPVQVSPLFDAISSRQCTRGVYDGKSLANTELGLLERAGNGPGVRMLLLTERSAMDAVLDHVVQANTAQMADPAFVKELKTWIRFNGAEAIAQRDGLYSACTGNPNLPTWLGQLIFGMVYKPKAENDKLAHQIRSSAGIAVFAGKAADKANWVAVGRCYERFALQATALGIRNAMLNQPVEVLSRRAPFATAMGLGDLRPDLVLRFGHGQLMPASLRRPVPAVLV
jgi:hypothetical protein